jgi:hypothetical protein
VDHLARVRGTADHGDPSLAEQVAQQDAGRAPVRRDEALGQRDDGGARRQPGLAQAGDDLVQPA